MFQSTAVLIAVLSASSVAGFSLLSHQGQRRDLPFRSSPLSRITRANVRVFSSESDEEAVERTSFDQAGKSLIDEEDQKRLQQMGDYDSNPDYQTDNIESMRAAIRERTARLGLEKSKVSQEYIQQKEAAATAAGSAKAASESSTQFGGLDLSQISDQVKTSNSDWNEDMPTMFYDPDDELTKEEQEEVDPVMTKNVIEQSISELQSAKWPDFLSAFREVALMLAVIALTAGLIIGWDRLLRNGYMSAGFIPTKEEIVNYASRFDGLELPQGWTDNMSADDVDNLGM